MAIKVTAHKLFKSNYFCEATEMKEKGRMWNYIGLIVVLLTIVFSVKLEYITIGSSDPTTRSICINGFPSWNPTAAKPSSSSSASSYYQYTSAESMHIQNISGDLIHGKQSMQPAAAPELLTSSSQIKSEEPRPNDGAFRPSPNISLEEAFYVRMKTLNVGSISDKADPNLRTQFLPNNNFMHYELLAMENVCMNPDGSLLLVNISQEEVAANVSAIPELYFVWNDIYAACGNASNERCTGVRYTQRLPENSSWIAGNTLHLLPYLGNSMHNWCERIYPNILARFHPFNETTPTPIHHFLIHRFDEFMEEAINNHVLDRSLLLWQFRMLMELSISQAPGGSHPDYLLVRNQANIVCFERFLLQMHDADRMDHTRIPAEIYSPAMRQMRLATFNFFGVPLPRVSVPPKRLRVLVHGRTDASRRMVRNTAEVVAFLQNMTRPKVEVFELEEMVRSGQISYDFADMLSIFSQIDMAVLAHGTVTGNTFFMPEGAGVVEVFGPCNWSNSNYTDLSDMHTWMRVHSDAFMLKHDRSNPFAKSIPNPERGNTTECREPFYGVPDYTVDTEKLGKIIQSFAYPVRPGDPLTSHWLYDWDKDPAAADVHA